MGQSNCTGECGASSQRDNSEQELAPEWLSWIVTNLLGGVSTAKLVDGLVEEDVPKNLAQRTVDAVAHSPLTTAALAHARKGQRAELTRRLLIEQQRLGDPSSEVPRRDCVDRETFLRRYVATNTPVIFTDLVPRWPGFKRWSPENFKQRFGHVTLEVAQGRDADSNYDMNTERLTRPMRLAEFVDYVTSVDCSNDAYMVAKNRNLDKPELQCLFEEMWFPEGWLDAKRVRRSSALWFGPKGTITPLHHDTSNILFCQVSGRKRFHLLSPLQTELADNALHMYAQLDPTSDEGREQLSSLHVKECTLEPGEALFIPAGYWHHVQSLDVSISVAVNSFTFPNTFDWFRPGNVS